MLGGKVVSAGAGTPQINQLKLAAKEHGISYKSDIKTFDKDEVAYAAMRSGRLDAYASTLVSLQVLMHMRPTDQNASLHMPPRLYQKF